MKTFVIKLNIELTKAETLPDGASKKGCSFRGVYVIADYIRIHSILGDATLLEENEGDGKVQAEWILSNEKGDKALTIYDWKENIDYSEVTNWHVGGNYNKSDVIAILTQLGFEESELEYHDC